MNTKTRKSAVYENAYEKYATAHFMKMTIKIRDIKP